MGSNRRKMASPAEGALEAANRVLSAAHELYDTVLAVVEPDPMGDGLPVPDQAELEGDIAKVAAAIDEVRVALGLSASVKQTVTV